MGKNKGSFHASKWWFTKFKKQMSFYDVSMVKELAPVSHMAGTE